MRISGENTEFTDVDIPTKGRQASNREYNASAKGRARQNRYRYIVGRKEYLEREFIAYDGEGISLDDGTHLYTLFASSRGIHLQDDSGLASADIFDAILQAKRDYPTAIHVIYGGSYDFNMMFTDIPIYRIEQLYEDGSCLWRQYRIQWRRGKSLQITDRTLNESVIVYDVVSFFQRPFVQACDEYLADTELWQSVRDMVIANKATRGKFTVQDNADVDVYNNAELRLLVLLMSELRTRLNKVQLRPSRWDGPGAIATALLQREGAKHSMAQCPPRVAEGGRYAYFGGRFEMLKSGDVKAAAYEYDINSAYPSALRHVPNLASGEWGRARVAYGMDDFAIFRITWEAGDDWPQRFPNPFPARYPDGRVIYPRKVTGWYWAPEVFVAERAHIGKLTIHEGYRFHPTEPLDKPFHFIEPMYLKRQALKKAGDGAHVGLKLALNSLYGKSCQRIGWRIDKTGKLRTPPFHQLEWAGYVTSHCRATIFNAALDSPDNIIAFETDALFSRVELNVDIGKGLGQWEDTKFTHLAYAQSGFYFGTTEGKPFAKTRGIDRGSMTYADMRGKFWTDEPYVDAKLTRFIGVGLARLLNDWNRWRRWETVPKRISLEPSGKRVHKANLCYTCHKGWQNAWHECMVPIPSGNMIESCAFPIPWINPDPAMPDENLTEDHADEMSAYYE